MGFANSGEARTTLTEGGIMSFPKISYTQACDCPERRKPVRKRNWRVRQKRCNFSAFNGYHYTPSDYSLVVCCSCSALWRTKAAFVDLLIDEWKLEVKNVVSS
jgi:hypothetical protein